jgi:hypothetical protein
MHLVQSKIVDVFDADKSVGANVTLFERVTHVKHVTHVEYVTLVDHVTVGLRVLHMIPCFDRGYNMMHIRY